MRHQNELLKIELGLQLHARVLYIRKSLSYVYGSRHDSRILTMWNAELFLYKYTLERSNTANKVGRHLQTTATDCNEAFEIIEGMSH